MRDCHEQPSHTHLVRHRASHHPTNLMHSRKTSSATIPHPPGASSCMPSSDESAPPWWWWWWWCTSLPSSSSSLLVPSPAPTGGRGRGRERGPIRKQPVQPSPTPLLAGFGGVALLLRGVFGLPPKTAETTTTAGAAAAQRTAQAGAAGGSSGEGGGRGPAFGACVAAVALGGHVRFAGRGRDLEVGLQA
eukprot:733853-Pelagomonas_calceolata.AAC.4